MKEQIEWLFFDVGSTLMNEEKGYLHRMHDMAEQSGKSLESIYQMAVGFYKQNKRGDLEVVKQLGLAKQKWYHEDEVLYADAVPCLETLHKKYKIGVIANQSLGTEDRLRQHGILKYIDLVVASAEEGVVKPDHRIFEIALERSNCKPEHAIMIGDRIDNDIVPAKEMGMGAIWVKQGFGGLWSLSQREEPDEIVMNLTELTRLLMAEK